MGFIPLNYLWNIKEKRNERKGFCKGELDPDSTAVRAPSWAKRHGHCSTKLFLGCNMEVRLELVSDVWCTAFGLRFLWWPKDGNPLSELWARPLAGVTVDGLLQTHKYRDHSAALGLKADLGWTELCTVPDNCCLTIRKGFMCDKSLPSQIWKLVVSFYVGCGGYLNTSYWCRPKTLRMQWIQRMYGLS